MSWGPFYANVEIEGEPYSWFKGRGVDAIIGAGRFEIMSDDVSDGCGGEEINDVQYRALVVRRAVSLARSNGRKPLSKDVALAQQQVDQDLRKKDISRSFRW